jgi:tetratricopeptide (TPR) repeat protein
MAGMSSLIPAALLCVAALAQETKNAVPSDDLQAVAERTVRATYKEEYGEKTAAGLQRLARKLLEQAGETRDDLALRFVLFREACEVASRAGDLETLLRAVDDLYGGFQVSGISLKAPSLLRIEPTLTKPDDLRRLAEVLLRLVRDALDLDQFDVAAKAAQSSQACARKAKDGSLATRADAAARSVTEVKAGYEKARKSEQALADAPHDPAANQAWGEWLCLQRGRWDKGLAFLLKAPPSPLRTMAEREFAGSAERESLIEVADGWWELADREKHPQRRSHLLAHARSIYTAALPKSTGEIRAKVGRRLEFDPEAPAKK